MSTRDERLGQFFGGHFHQDWAILGAQTWQDVVTQYVRDMPKADVTVLLDDLRSYIAEAKSKGWNNLDPTFQCAYDPRPDGQTERQWAEEIADLLAKLLTN